MERIGKDQKHLRFHFVSGQDQRTKETIKVHGVWLSVVGRWMCVPGVQAGASLKDTGLEFTRSHV